MTNQATATKARLREEMRERRRQTTPESRTLDSLQICQRLLDSPLWPQAVRLLLFWPLPSEPDLRPLFPAAWAAHKTTAILRLNPQTNQFEPRIVSNLESDLEPNSAFGITQPNPACPQLPAKQLDLLLVPGVAFTLSGCRLGRGQGHYDRLLTQTRGISCGIAFEWQITPQIPMEPHDMPVDYLFTSARFHAVSGESGR